MKIQLSDGEAARIKRPVNGRGGFQSLLRRMQKVVDANNVMDLADEDVERAIRYLFEYGQGGFQERARPVAKKK